MQPEAVSVAVGKVPAHSSHPPAAAQPATWPKLDTPEFRRMAGERGRGWLDARHRDAAGLVAMWDLSGDEALLREAAERFPDDPRVCVAMIGLLNGDVKKALPWIERLLAVEPQNPQAHYLKAWALISGKDQAGALAVLQYAATLQGPRENHVRERAATAREAALASGMSEGDAARISLRTPLEAMTSCRVSGSISNALGEELGAAQALDNEAPLMELSGLALVTAEALSNAGAVTLREEQMANNLTPKVLAGLSDDTEIGPGGRTVLDMKSEAEERYEELIGVFEGKLLTQNFLESASDAVLSSYADMFLEHGEQCAVSWLLDEAQQAKEKGKSGE